MQTEFPERYITLGLKIAYYRKRQALRRKVLRNALGRVLTLLLRWKEPERFVEFHWRRYLKLHRF